MANLRGLNKQNSESQTQQHLQKKFRKLLANESDVYMEHSVVHDLLEFLLSELLSGQLGPQRNDAGIKVGTTNKYHRLSNCRS